MAGGEPRTTGPEPYQARVKGAANRASRLGMAALIAAAPGLTLYLSFSNGGYFPNSVGIVTICVCGLFVLRVTLADRPFEGYTRGVGLAVLTLGLFALLQLVSIAWSHTAAPALDDFERTFLYVLVLALFASLPRSTRRISWLIRLLAAVMSAACIAGLITRLLPHVWPTTLSSFPNRLDYPLGYANALGALGAFACILLLHLASSLDERRLVRVGAAALFPAVATAALLTYSRGGLAVAVIGLLAYTILGRSRGMIAGLTATVPATAIALHSAYDAVLLSGNHPTSGRALAQGRHVAVTVGVAILLAAALRTVGLVLDRWPVHPHPLLPFARVPRWAARLATVGVVLVGLILAGAPGFASREYNRFINVQSLNTAQTRERLTDTAGSHRILYWRVAVKQFSQHPILGQGAGTFRTYYAQHRPPLGDIVTDTHSLYLETLGETGVVGLVLLAVTLGSIIFMLGWRLRGRSRPLYAALFAITLAWILHNAVDWDWQMPAVTLWLFAVGGLLMARPRPAKPEPVSRLNRTALAASFLALAIAPLLIGFSYQRLRAAGNAFVAGNCAQAKERALSSISLLAVRPQAYEILGYCDLQQSYPIEGLAAMRKAASYDQQDWEYHYSLAIALGANGIDPLSEARLAVRLNPRQPIVQEALRVFEGSGQGWVGASHILMLQTLESGALSVSQL